MNVGCFTFQVSCILNKGKKCHKGRGQVKQCEERCGGGAELFVTTITRQPQDATMMKVSTLNGVKEQLPWSLK